MPQFRSIRMLHFASPLVIALLAATSTASAQHKSALGVSAKSPESAARRIVSAHYGHIPLSFEANRGQSDPSVKFLAHGEGYSLFLRQGEALLVVRDALAADAAASINTAQPRTVTVPDANNTHTVRVQLGGANPDARVRGETEQLTRTNYFLGSDPDKWKTDIPNYGRVRYSGIYPGIDLVYYGNQRRIEHDFVVAPEADPSRIRMILDGASNMHIDSESGDIVLSFAAVSGSSELRLLRPITYQEFKGHRTSVASSYKLLADGRIGFAIGSYNHAHRLVIDPVLVYSTYLGGSGNASGQGDQGNGIAVDSAGNAYVVGTTYSVDFPVTPGTFQSKNKSALAKTGGTVFVSKINPEGTALVYSTYLGGSGGDFGYAIALDSTNHAYITGATYSRDFPLTCGAFHRSNDAEEISGGATVFVAKLLTLGGNLAYSTYVGGSGNRAVPGLGDVGQAIAVDSAGDAFVAGYTYSPDFPHTRGVFQARFEGGATTPNAFVFKLSPDGSKPLYASLLGGSGGDFANAIAIDSKGDAFVAGSTASANFPVTSGAFQRVSSGPTGFITELSPTGANAVFSTYLGGSGGDSAQAIAVDGDGFAYVAGTTGSGDFPVTTGTLEDGDSGVGPLLAGNGPTGFAAKLKQDGSALVYATYLEGIYTSISGIAVDGSGATYLAGTTVAQGISTYVDYGGFQGTEDAIASTASSGKSAFIVKLDPTATYLNYATLLSGSKNDQATAIAVDHAGNAYLTGFATSTDFPVTSQAFQKTNKAASAGATNAFAARFSLASAISQTGYPMPIFTQIPTITALGDGLDMNCRECSCVWGDDSSIGFYSILTEASMMPVFKGPADPTGNLEIDADGGDVVDSDESGGPTYAAFGPRTLSTYAWPVSKDFTATYSGDKYYLSSSAEETFTVGENCPPLSGQTSESKTNALNLVHGHLRQSLIASPIKPSVRISRRSVKDRIQGAKFTPPPAIRLRREFDADVEAAGSEASTVPCKSPLLPLTVTVNPATRHYGTASPKYTYTVSGAAVSSPVTVAVAFIDSTTLKSPIGKYTVLAQATLGGTGQANYELLIREGTLTIAPAPLTVTALSATTIYGTPVTTVNYNATGLVNGDSITVTPKTSATAASPVGTYRLWATASGPAIANYHVNYLPGTLTVTPAPLTVTIGHLSRTYGSPNTLPYYFIGFVNGDSAAVVSGAPSLSTKATASSHIGAYRINVDVGTLKAANYALSATPGTVQITPARLYLDVDDVAIQAGQPIPTSFAYTFAGFVLNQTKSVVTGAPNLSTKAESTSPPGVYAISGNVGTLKAPNYSIAFRKGKLTIQP